MQPSSPWHPLPPPGSSALSPRAPPLIHGGAFQLGLSPVGALGSPPNDGARRFANRSRHSPRQIKLQRVAPMPPTPAMPYGDRSAAVSARHELFQFHQLLRDVVASTTGVSTLTSSLSSQSVRDREVLDLLTSDRGDAVLREFFRQWQALQHQSAGSNSDDGSGAVLWEVLETLFRNLPLVIPEREAAADPKAFFRYVDALKALRDVLIALLFAQPGRQKDINDDDEVEGGDDPLHSSHSRRFTVLAAKQQRPTRSDHPNKRLPLFEHCRQLERELQTLRRRISIAGIDDPISRGRRVRDEDVGLLHEATEVLLLEFWQLPRGERLGFFSQIASQMGEDDAAAILKVFVENSSAQNFTYAWDALQACPQFEDALHAAAVAIMTQTQASPASEGNASTAAATGVARAGLKSPLVSEASEERNHARRATVRTPGKRYRSRGRDSRFVDLSGITDGFDDFGGDSSEESGSSGDGDEFDRHGTGGGRKLKKLFIRERGRTPPNSSAVGRRRQQHHKHHHHRHGNGIAEHDEDGSSDKEDARGEKKRAYRFMRSDSGLTLAQKLHGDLIELIKEEYSPDDQEVLRAPQILDAGWKLLEALESHRAKDGGSKSGYNRRNLSLASNGAAVEASSQRYPAESDDQKLLTVEQQFMVKVDQLQAVMSTLSSASIEEMGTDVITSVFRRLPVLNKLFSSISRGISEAAGVVSPSYDIPVAAPAAAAVGHSGHNRKASIMAPVGLKAPSLGDGDVEALDVDAVAELLGKFSKFVRSLVPVLELSDVGGDNGSALAIMKLADDMEIPDDPPVDAPGSPPLGVAAVVNAAATAKTGGMRRRSTIEYQRRLEIMSRLRALAKTSDFESVATVITATVNTITVERETLLATIAADNKPSRARRRMTPEDSDPDELDTADGEDEVDEVIRLAKSAKTRRASGRAAAAVVSKSDENEDEGDDATDSVARSSRDIPMNIRHANAAKGIKLFSIGILLRVIDQLYRDNYECAVSTLQYGNRRMEFSEFMYDWHIRKYGLKALAQRHLLKLIQSLRKYERKAFQCQLCLRFLGIQSPLGYHEHKFVLGLLDRWSLGTFSGTSRHRVALSKQQFKIRVAHAVTTVQEALSERFGLYFRSADAIAQRIRSHALTGDDEFIRENDLLQIAVDEWGQQRDRIAQVLQAVYVAGDLNGDGSLEFDEFAAVVAHLAPSIDDLFVQKVFAAAHDHVKPRRISFERFLDVVLLERLLSTSGPGSSSASKGNGAAGSSASSGQGKSIAGSGAGGGGGGGGGSSDDRRGAFQHTAAPPSAGYSTLEEEEAYQFNLLQETWSNDRDAVMGVLKTGIPHAPTAASLSFRVAFLDQLLAKRVDAKTAWLCHRQIMREIGRYQNLNADEIVVLKTKEERFKKAVLAIRNMQQLGTQFLQLAAAKRVGSSDSASPTVETTSSDEAASSTEDQQRELTNGNAGGESATYTSVVDKTLSEEDGDDRLGQADAVVAALENQLRQQFVERADERAIDDFMTAMHRLRRASVLSLPSDSILSSLPDVVEGEQDAAEEEEVGVEDMDDLVDDEEEEDEEEDQI